MARRTIENTSVTRPPQTIEYKNRAIQKIDSRINELTQFDPDELAQANRDPKILSLEAKIEDSLFFAFGQNTIQYNRYRRAANLDRAPLYVKSDISWVRDGYLGPTHQATELNEAREII